MYQINNFTNNDDIKMLDSLGAFSVIEYQRDLSVMPGEAITAYYASKMNVKRRQVVCDLSKANVTIQAGSMHWMAGESTIKPEYTGSGTLVLEPTYKHILLLDVADWNGSVVLDDGLFLGCESTLKHKAVMRSNLSSAALGKEGLVD